jgi:hypothetical protein
MHLFIILAEETKVRSLKVGYLMCTVSWNLRVPFRAVCFVFSSFGPQWKWLCGNARLRLVCPLKALAAEFECGCLDNPAGLRLTMRKLEKTIVCAS